MLCTEKLVILLLKVFVCCFLVSVFRGRIFETTVWNIYIFIDCSLHNTNMARRGFSMHPGVLHAIATLPLVVIFLFFDTDLRLKVLNVVIKW